MEKTMSWIEKEWREQGELVERSRVSRNVTGYGELKEWIKGGME